MKAVLVFNLPEDSAEHLLALSGPGLSAVVDDLDNMLRGWLKYGHEFKDADSALQAVRDALTEGLSNMEVDVRNLP